MSEALVLVIENSDTNIGAGEAWDNGEYTAESEPLEEEAIKCIYQWKAFGPDIPIYVICPSKRQPKRSTITKIEDFGAEYIHHYMSETDTFTCGYWNVPIAISWFEQNYDYDIIIHTDLDMYLIREPRPDLFKLDEGIDARVGILAREEMKDIHIGIYEQHHETNLIVARKGFYTDWWTKTCYLGERYDPSWERFADIEEFAVDVMHVQTHAIEPEEHYQIGERYPVDNIPDECLQNVCFAHRHPYESEQELAKYAVRLWRYENTKKNTV